MHPLTEDLVSFLQGPRAASILSHLAEEDLDPSQESRLVESLRPKFGLEERAALIDQARLRLRAREKFPLAQGMLFTQESLEQASSFDIATHRATWYEGFETVADLGCGLGGDSLAISQATRTLLCVDRDPVLCRLCQHNLSLSDRSSGAQVVCGDWTQLEARPEAAFADPSRRTRGRRVFGLHRMEPPIEAFEELLRRVSHLAIKVAPSLSHEEIPGKAEVLFVSHRGQCKEAVLLFGQLRQGSARQAVLLPNGDRLGSNGPESAPSSEPPGRYLYEPDPAVIRAGLVRQLAERIDAWQIDPQTAYLTSNRLRQTPFARAWEVLRHGPFQRKRLNRWLADLGTGDVVVKKRGFNVDPMAFRKTLKTGREGPLHTVFLTRRAGRAWMVVAD